MASKLTGYIDANLLPGEPVLYRAKRHWATCAGVPLLFLLVTLVFLPLLTSLALIFFLCSVATGVGAYLSYATSEFGLTDRRVLAKVGWLHRRSSEVLLSKIESIQVDQGIGGRMLDYGTLVVTGTGGTREGLIGIESQFEFYKRVQMRIAQAKETAEEPPRAAQEPPLRAPDAPRGTAWVRPPWEKDPGGKP
jgi:uncharacterized membrane protein YdbT with pleckstrin-like domain